MCDMMLTGWLLRTVDAERIGLVHYLTDPGEHLQNSKAVAAQIATNAPMSSWPSPICKMRIPDYAYPARESPVHNERRTPGSGTGAGETGRGNPDIGASLPRSLRDKSSKEPRS